MQKYKQDGRGMLMDDDKFEQAHDFPKETDICDKFKCF